MKVDRHSLVLIESNWKKGFGPFLLNSLRKRDSKDLTLFWQEGLAGSTSLHLLNSELTGAENESQYLLQDSHSTAIRSVKSSQ